MRWHNTFKYCLLGIVALSTGYVAFSSALAQPNNNSEVILSHVTASNPDQKISNTEGGDHTLPNTDGSIRILEFVLSDKVEGREPQNVVDKFSSTQERGYIFARLSSDKHAEMTFLWIRNGHEYARFNTMVHASRKWRTYSSTKLRPGHWQVKLLSDNQVLAEKSFLVD